jgi:hypothetical protein
MSFFSISIIRHKLSKRMLFFLSIPAICGGLCWGTYWLIELRPQYVELNPPPHEYMIWWGYTERSTLKWDDGGRYWLWRQEAICRKSQCGSWNDVVDFFNEWLEVEGWTLSDWSGDCSIVIPEIDLLERGENGYAIYWPSDTEGWNFSASVCLAVFSSSDDGFWNIVLGTSNPSFQTEFERSIQ